jgi:hypothetical protein
VAGSGNEAGCNRRRTPGAAPIRDSPLNARLPRWFIVSSISYCRFYPEDLSTVRALASLFDRPKRRPEKAARRTHTHGVRIDTGWLAVVPFGFGTNPPPRPRAPMPPLPSAPRTVWMNLHRRHRDDAYRRGMTFGPASAFPVHLFLSNGIKPNVESHSWTRNAVTHSLTTGTAALFRQRRRPWGCGRTTLWCPLFDRPKRGRKKPPDSTRCG